MAFKTYLPIVATFARTWTYYSNSRRTETVSASWGKLQLALLALRKPAIRLPFLLTT